MSVFSLSKRLPSCQLDKAALIELESLLLRKLVQFDGRPPDEIQQGYKAVLSDADSHETFGSLSEYRPDRLPDGLEMVHLAYLSRLEGTKCSEVHIRLHIRRAEFTIEMSASNPREEASDLFVSVEGFLRAKKNVNWLFNPSRNIRIPLVAGVIFVSFWYVVASSVPGHHFFGIPGQSFWSTGTPPVMPLSLILLASVYLALSIALPYTVFETQSFEKIRDRKKRTIWWVLGIAGTIFAGLVVAYVKHVMDW